MFIHSKQEFKFHGTSQNIEEKKQAIRANTDFVATEILKVLDEQKKHLNPNYKRKQIVKLITAAAVLGFFYLLNAYSK